MVETGLSSLHELYTNKIQFICHGLLGKSGLTVKSGQTVQLSAVGTSDPDGDKLSCRWFVYREAGDYNGTISIQNSNAKEASFTAPDVTRAGNIHVILEVKDDGEPNLYSYRRIIVSVEP